MPSIQLFYLLKITLNFFKFAKKFPFSVVLLYSIKHALNSPPKNAKTSAFAEVLMVWSHEN